MFMISAPTHPPGEPLPDPSQDASDAALVARQLRQLAELSELAMRRARETEQRASQSPSPQHDAAFDNAARTLRQIVALESWLIERRSTGAALRAKQAAETTRQHNVIQSNRLRRDAVQAIIAEPGFTPDQRYHLRKDLALRDFTAEGDLARPLGDIIARICRALSIPVPEAFAAQPASQDRPPPGPVPPRAPPPERRTPGLPEPPAGISPAPLGLQPPADTG